MFKKGEIATVMTLVGLGVMLVGLTAGSFIVKRDEPLKTFSRASEPTATPTPFNGANCVDSDRGNYPDTPGSVTTTIISFGSSRVVDYYDTCTQGYDGRKVLREYYCQGDQVKTFDQLCVNNCQEGGQGDYCSTSVLPTSLPRNSVGNGTLSISARNVTASGGTVDVTLSLPGIASAPTLSRAYYHVTANGQGVSVSPSSQEDLFGSGSPEQKTKSFILTMDQSYRARNCPVFTVIARAEYYDTEGLLQSIPPVTFNNMTPDNRNGCVAPTPTETTVPAATATVAPEATIPPAATVTVAPIVSPSDSPSPTTAPINTPIARRSPTPILPRVTQFPGIVTPVLSVECSDIRTRLSAALGSTCTSTNYDRIVDFNNSGSVDSADQSIFSRYQQDPIWCSQRSVLVATYCSVMLSRTPTQIPVGPTEVPACTPDGYNPPNGDATRCCSTNSTRSCGGGVCIVICGAPTPIPSARPVSPGPTGVAFCPRLPDLMALDYVDDNVLNVQDFLAVLTRFRNGNRDVSALSTSLLLANLGTNLETAAAGCPTSTPRAPRAQ